MVMVMVTVMFTSVSPLPTFASSKPPIRRFT
jgi:hypothetical protein